MAESWANIIVLGLTILACCGVGNAQQQDLPQPPELPTLSPQLPPRLIVFPEPPPVPSPPDAPIPDLGSLTRPPDKSKSRVKRALDRAMPNCLDAIFHICWSSPPGDGTALSEEDLEFVNDMRIGIYYFRNKNYRGAEMRFRDALNYKPGQPEATFKLAESLTKLGKNDEAKLAYESYLDSQPDGPYAGRARTSLQRLQKLSAGKN